MLRSIRPFRVAVGVLLTVVATAGQAQDSGGWTFSIGTGLSNNSVDGTIGFTSSRGPETGDIDLKPDDFNDLTDSAAGFSLVAARNKLQLAVDYGNLTLLDESTTLLAGGAIPVSSRFEQEIEFLGLTAFYRLRADQRNQLYVFGGARYTSHDYDVRLGIGQTQLLRTLDQDWTVGVGGIRHVHVLRERLAWTNSLGIGFGDTDSYSHLSSSIGWRMLDRWTLLGFANWKKIDFENAGPGNPDWYLYDVDEKDYGLGFAYTRPSRRQ